MRVVATCLAVLFTATTLLASAPARPVNTNSIVARDPASGQLPEDEELMSRLLAVGR